MHPFNWHGEKSSFTLLQEVISAEGKNIGLAVESAKLKTWKKGCLF
jgi:hypothetical protein